MKNAVKNPERLSTIVGLGMTGFSCVRYLAALGEPLAVVDSRINPPYLDEFRQQYPDIPFYLGSFPEDILLKSAQLIVSPGVSLHEPVFVKATAKGIPIIGDIELFVRQATSPIVAITGSNAKGTVTTLVGQMAKAAGWSVKVGGNIGTPALDLLSQPSPDLYVLELSSFQLETTYSLHAAVASILNISSDHLDRYEDLTTYIAAKQRIYHNCNAAVYNRDDLQTTPGGVVRAKQFSFGLDEPHDKEFGLRHSEGQYWLAQGKKLLFPTAKLRIRGRHNWANALAALAIGATVAIPESAMLHALAEFKGLPHRCEWVAEHQGVIWYNDSKGTNVGATLAALEGLGSQLAGKLILIAGGLGKDADFSPLRAPVAKYVKTIILLGQDAPLLEQSLKDVTKCLYVKSMEDAVSLAKKEAVFGDAVLLSPACASWDMFKNFEHRGEVFMAAVKEHLS